jgi:hypothetical protein
MRKFLLVGSAVLALLGAVVVIAQAAGPGFGLWPRQDVASRSMAVAVGDRSGETLAARIGATKRDSIRERTGCSEGSTG